MWKGLNLRVYREKEIQKWKEFPFTKGWKLSLTIHYLKILSVWLESIFIFSIWINKLKKSSVTGPMASFGLDGITTRWTIKTF